MTASFHEELDELRLQVELMALRADQAIHLACRVLADGDSEAAQELLASDDEIDSMHAGLTERCYELLVRYQPMASDLRLVVSVVRVLGVLERIGNLCLRIANTIDDQALLANHPAVFRVLLDLADTVRERFTIVQAAWSKRDLDTLDQLDELGSLEEFAGPLIERIQELEGDDAVRVAMAAFVVGRSLDRIGDHTTVMAVRLKYLITGDTMYLAEEVGA